VVDATLVPSRLIDPADRVPVEIRPVNRPSRYRLLEFQWRALRWAAVTLRLYLTGKLTADVYARSVRRVFEELGGFWIKVGQLLSLRVDMFSPELCRELSSLQGKVAGFPADVARETVERELGEPIDCYFDEFAELPFAAASIGQIHRAHLREENAWVAVKIQRPYLEEMFARDLEIVRWVFRLLKIIRFYPFMRWDVGLREVGEIMREELDCRYEAAAYSRMKKQLAAHGVSVPKVFRKYSTRRLLVTEFVHAVLMADYIQVASTNPTRLATWLRENNIEPHKLALRLLESGFRQIFEDNSYHGDMHPGNILVLRDSRIALIDFGAISFTEVEYWQKARLFVKALIVSDYAKAADTAFLLCGALPANVDLERVKDRLIEALRSWGARTLVRDLDYREKSLDNAFVEAGKILFLHGFAMQWALMRVRRGAATLDASIIALYPDMDTNKQFRRFLRRSNERQLRRIARGLLPRAVTGIANAIEVAENAYEQALYQGSLMRRQAQVFEGTTSKFAYLFAVFYRQFFTVQLIAFALLTAVFLYQHYTAVIKPRIGAQFGRFLNLFPFLDPQIWVVVFAFIVYSLFTTLKLWRAFAAKDTGPTESTPR
jgi:ubiquinone biosynthesis protein